MEVDWPSLAISVAAAAIACAAWWETRKARKAAETSARTSKQSAHAAGRSADAAERSAAETAKLTQIESGRRIDEVSARHDALAPPHPVEILTTLEPSATNGERSLFGTFSAPRDYYVHAEGWTGSSFTPVTVFPTHVDANKTYRFHIEHWPDGRTTPQTLEIRFQLWPPHPARSEGTNWVCPCDQPAIGAAGAPGHWELRVPIKPPSIPRIRFM